MVTEIAILYIKNGEGDAFEKAFFTAQQFIICIKGYISHELLKCREATEKYLLVVQWQKIEDHIEGFRKSAGYNEWKNLLHHFYEPFPEVEHYDKIF